jgi:hypothetical protein
LDAAKFDFLQTDKPEAIAVMDTRAFLSTDHPSFPEVDFWPE